MTESRKKHEAKIRELTKKYSSTFITKNGGYYNLRTLKRIALEAGMSTPYVNRSAQGLTTINCEIVDRGGDIEMIYKVCLYLLRTYGN